MRIIYRGLVTAAAIFCITAPAKAQFGGFGIPEGAPKASHERQMVMRGKLNSFNVGAGKIARTKCITGFEKYLASAGVRASFPDKMKKYKQAVRVARNPNNLKYRSEQYTFFSKDAYSIKVECKLTSDAKGLKTVLIVKGRKYGGERKNIDIIALTNRYYLNIAQYLVSS